MTAERLLLAAAGCYLAALSASLLFIFNRLRAGLWDRLSSLLLSVGFVFQSAMIGLRWQAQEGRLSPICTRRWCCSPGRSRSAGRCPYCSTAPGCSPSPLRSWQCSFFSSLPGATARSSR